MELSSLDIGLRVKRKCEVCIFIVVYILQVMVFSIFNNKKVKNYVSFYIFQVLIKNEKKKKYIKEKFIIYLYLNYGMLSFDY